MPASAPLVAPPPAPRTAPVPPPRARSSRAPFLLAPFLLLAVAGTARAHPPLVGGRPANCRACHQDRFPAGATVHAPARDTCDACHVVTIAADGTRIDPVRPEPSLCISCHKDRARAASGTDKFPHPPAAESCLTCHDPHAGVGPAILKATPAELCATCHDRDERNAGHGGQITAATDCVRCHDPHGTGTEHLLRGSHLHAPFADGSCDACHRPPADGRVRLQSGGEKICRACHVDLPESAPEGGSLHAAMRGDRGRAGCLNCHDPHLGVAPGLLLAPGARLCGGCHRGVLDQARAKGGHPPAAGDCLRCHRPHGSDQPRLLRARPPGLCLECHDPAGPRLARAHLQADPRTLDCGGCHTPHGAGRPHLLARHVHPPVLEGCDTCHEGRHDRLAEAGGTALCLTCHEAVGAAAAAAGVPHPAMEAAGCADCHNPHASEKDRLLKGRGGEICVACHAEQAPGKGEVAHGVIASIGCQACHEPHGGSQPKLLRLAGADLCLSCHDPARPEFAAGGETVRLLGRFEVPAAWARSIATLRLSADGQRDHPTPNHRTLGTPTEAEMRHTRTTFKGALTCLTCHDPHKGKSAILLRWNAVRSMEACTRCHTK